MNMKESGLIYAFLFDGRGGGRRLSWDEVRRWSSEEGILWIHLDYTAPDARAWITEESGLDGIFSSALLTDETRPRTMLLGDALLMALRGINLNPGADAEDMVALRIRADSSRIITTRRRKLLSIADIAESLEKGSGPSTSGGFIVRLTKQLISRMEGTIEDLEDRVAEVEEEVLSTERYALRNELAAIRKQSIILRRFLGPQREAMHRLCAENVRWLKEGEKIELREITDQLVRYVEDLDSLRDRASVTQEELANRLAEQMNTRMYVLSLVAAVFLPLGFLTGLLGINVGGIPGAENSSAFLIFLLLLIGIVIMQVLIFKKKKWL